MPQMGEVVATSINWGKAWNGRVYGVELTMMPAVARRVIGYQLRRYRQLCTRPDGTEMSQAEAAKQAHPNRGCRSWGLKPPVSSRLRAM